MQMVKHEKFRLYDLTEIQIEGCRHIEYAPFSDDLNAFNEAIDADDLNETLNELAEAIYGQCSRWFEIIDDSYDGEGKFRIELNDDDYIEIQDIIDMISVFAEHTLFYILVDAQLTEYRWIVVVPKGTVYSG